MKILYVEDNAVFAVQACRQFLSAHAVTVVPSLVAARTALANEQYDLLLVDYDLEDGKGDELVRLCRNQYPGLGMIGASSHHAGNTALLKAGAQAACGKVDFARIPSMIESLRPGVSKQSKKPAPDNERTRP